MTAKPPEQRPILLAVDDPDLGQLRELVKSYGNWHDFEAFNRAVAGHAELAEQLDEARDLVQFAHRHADTMSELLNSSHAVLDAALQAVLSKWGKKTDV